MITSQAATVLAAFRHLTGIVSVLSPERLPEVMGNIATAAASSNPHVVMQVMQTQDDPGDQIAVVARDAAAFDDVKVAQLLATALALEGQASDRLATIFNTIAPDDDRKRRVLTMTRSMLSETDFGSSGQFQVLWTSMEELLVSYNEQAVRVGVVSRRPRRRRRPRRADGGSRSAAGAAGLDGDARPGQRARAVGHAADRSADARARRDARRRASRDDMAALAEDLLLSGAYDDASDGDGARWPHAAGRHRRIGRDACRQALDRLGESLAMREYGGAPRRR